MSSIPPERPPLTTRERQRLRSAAKRIERQERNQARNAILLAKMAVKATDAYEESNYLEYLNFLENWEWQAKQAAARQRRRVHVENAGPMFTADEWLDLCRRADNLCLRCGRDGPLTVDHIVPVSKGGTNDISNIQCLCRSCNSHKGTKSTDYR